MTQPPSTPPGPTSLGLRLVPLAEPEDVPALVAWLCSDRWPFHGSPSPQPAEVEQRVRDGAYTSSETQTFWLAQAHTDERVGLLSLQELGDLTPIFDLRLGGEALELIARQVFEVHGKTRVEGHTRVDNVGMRRAFLKRGWVKEAHYRRCWPGEASERPPELYDALTYALLRSDWEQGTRTPVDWDDEPASTRPSDAHHS